MPFALIQGKIVEGDVIPSSLGVIGECLFVPKDNPEPQWILKPGVIFLRRYEASIAWFNLCAFMRENGRQFPEEWGIEL